MCYHKIRQNAVFMILRVVKNINIDKFSHKFDEKRKKSILNAEIFDYYIEYSYEY
jgi:hypothetical protein